MIKILTYINTASLVLAVSVGALAYFQRGKITESIMSEVQKQLPSLVKGSMPKIPSVPKSTGFVLPLK
tara:strand:- start:6521 stop:6724 length:204 start_codon:yes stop_codon:yes gene_type:complete